MLIHYFFNLLSLYFGYTHYKVVFSFSNVLHVRVLLPFRRSLLPFLSPLAASFFTSSRFSHDSIHFLRAPFPATQFHAGKRACLLLPPFLTPSLPPALSLLTFLPSVPPHPLSPPPLPPPARAVPTRIPRRTCRAPRPPRKGQREWRRPRLGT